MTEKAILIDTTKCTGCRGCQVACKQWNNLPAEATVGFAGPGYQNPADVSPNTYTVLEFHGDDLDADGNWNFLKFQCMHCVNAPCKMVCDSMGLQAIVTSPEGFLYVDNSKCKAKPVTAGGCRPQVGIDPVSKAPIFGPPPCVTACPYGVPKWGKVDTDGDGIPDKKVMRKCRGCYDRAGYNEPQPVGVPTIPTIELKPACVKTCNTGAMDYGDRSAMIAAAAARAADAAVKAKYPNVNVYGATGPYGGGHVIYVLTQPPAYYGLL